MIGFAAMGGNRRFGRYRVVRPLAKGGMGEVFLCRAEGPQGFQRPVVVKRMLPRRSAEPRYVDMFIDEARLSARLSHAHIAQVFDFGQDGEGYFLAMEYVHGRDLRATLERCLEQGSPLPVAVAVKIARCVALALDYAHQQQRAGQPLGLVHRDVTPHNILLGFNDDVKLSDFGVALARGRLHETEGERLKGKLLYLAPEQARGETLDQRTDLYALGLVLYEALCGAPALLAAGEAAILAKARQADITPLRARQPGLPDSLYALVERSLRLDAQERFQTGAELADALERFSMEQMPASSTNRVGQLLRTLFPEITHYEVDLASAERLLDTTDMERASSWAKLSPRELSEASTHAAGKADRSRRRRWLVAIGLIGLIGSALALGARYQESRQAPQAAAASAGRDPGDDGEAAKEPAPPPAPSRHREPAMAPSPRLPSVTPAATEARGPASPRATVAPRRPKKPAVPPPSKVVVPALGRLLVNAAPYGEVWIDGKQVGPTPFAGSLPAGIHSIRVHNKALGREKTASVVVRPGETTRQIFRLRAPPISELKAPAGNP